ncbi:MAG: O-antigen ligase family protein, partial [Clostridia bacterium]|nr:O-antigen ligase family protein [Clostridia bacterium]
ERRMKTFRRLAWLWSLPVALSAILGLWLALTGAMFVRQSDGAVAGVLAGRLYMICDCNMYGFLCCMALALVLYLLLERPRPLAACALTLMALLLYAALSLTDSRTAQLGLLPAAFLFAALIVWRLLRTRRGWLRPLAGAAAGLLFCAAVFFGFRLVVTGCDYLSGELRQTVLSPASSPQEPAEAVALMASVKAAAPSAPAKPAEIAQTAEAGELSSRGLGDTSTLAQRFGIWTYALERLPEEKDVLLRGATPALTHDLFIDPATSYQHLHNAYLAVLLSYGLPGFLLMLLFFVLLAVQACRLLFSRRPGLPLALRFLPALLLPILVINCAEEMLFVRNFVSEMDVWLAIISGYTFVIARECRAQ